MSATVTDSLAAEGEFRTGDVDRHRMESGLERLKQTKASVSIEPGSRLLNVPVSLQAIIGTINISLSELMNLRAGDVLTLNRNIGEPVDVSVNGKIVGHGQIVICDERESRIGISITELVGN